MGKKEKMKTNKRIQGYIQHEIYGNQKRTFYEFLDLLAQVYKKSLLAKKNFGLATP